uniref:Uncharacterized protein n=1 Tax=Romanomermis culicivorax TaxID=13658 RepID=A0A915HUP5_ROMCU
MEQGDIVLKQNFQAHKFDPKWSGPYQVTRVKYPNVTIQATDYDNVPQEIAHVDQLKKDKKPVEEILTMEEESWSKRQKKPTNCECGLEAEVIWINNIGLETKTNIHIKITPLFLHLHGKDNKAFQLWVNNRLATTSLHYILLLNWYREADEKLLKFKIPVFNDIKLSMKASIKKLKQIDSTIVGIVHARQDDHDFLCTTWQRMDLKHCSQTGRCKVFPQR